MGFEEYLALRETLCCVTAMWDSTPQLSEHELSMQKFPELNQPDGRFKVGISQNAGKAV